MFSRLMAKWRRGRTAKAERPLLDSVCQPLENSVKRPAIEAMEQRLMFATSLIPVTDHNDLVFDAVHNDLLITGRGKIQRYDLHTKTLSTYVAGVNLLGADITPDGRFMYAVDGGANTVYKLDLNTGTVTSLPYGPTWGEDHGFDLKILSNGKALFTEEYNGSRWTDIRQIDLASDSISKFTSSGAYTPLACSADRNTLFWVDFGQPSRRNIYDAAGDAFVASRDISREVSGQGAVSRDGQLVAMILDWPTILNRSLDDIKTLSNINGGFCFDPLQDTFYGVNADTDQVIAYDTHAWHERFRVSIGEDVKNTGDRFGNNVMRISSDGTLLFLTTPQGIRVISLPQSPQPRSTIYVDANQSGATGDGSSWDNAYADLQVAIGSAVSGDVIRVAGGTYKPAVTTDRTISFGLKSGVSLLGGYAGHRAANPDARDVARYRTILSGDIGVAGDDSDNSYHVIMGNGTDSTAVLDGFTITAGHASGEWPTDAGAGMFNSSGSPTLKNCTFTANWAEGGGGGMLNMDSAPTLTNCAFSGNGAEAGGGMYNYYRSSPTLTNCTFSGNSATDGGGGMYNNSSSPRLTRCSIIANVASEDGGGMYNTDSSPVLSHCTFRWNRVTNDAGGGMYNLSSSPTVTDCAFFGNSGGRAGGGTYNVASAPAVTNCTFSGNSALYAGGGMDNVGSWPVVMNCVFVGNTATGTQGAGGGMFNEDSSNPTLINCTLTANVARQSGGGIYNDGADMVILGNCIVWGNRAKRAPQIGGAEGTTHVSGSDVQGGGVGEGNIAANPRFVRTPSRGPDRVWGTADDDEGELRLQAASPCIDSGSNFWIDGGNITVDVAGSPRTVDVPGGRAPGAIVDMGAYETLAVSIKDASVIEGDRGTRTMAFTLALSAASGEAVWVRYSTADGTAELDSDYRREDRSVTFSPGQTRKTIRVVVNGDKAREHNETLKVRLTDVMNAIIGDGQGIGTIIDDDSPKTPRSKAGMATPAAEIKSSQAMVNFELAGVGRASSGDSVANTATADLILGKVSMPPGCQLANGLAGMQAPSKSDVFTIKPATKKAAS